MARWSSRAPRPIALGICFTAIWIPTLPFDQEIGAKSEVVDLLSVFLDVGSDLLPLASKIFELGANAVFRSLSGEIHAPKRINPTFFRTRDHSCDPLNRWQLSLHLIVRPSSGLASRWFG